jgi:hypothetical protein
MSLACFFHFLPSIFGEFFLTLFTLIMQLVTNYVHTQLIQNNVYLLLIWHTQLIQDNVYLLLIWLSYVRLLKFDTDI